MGSTKPSLSSPRIHVRPNQVRADDDVSIRISGCSPTEMVTVTGWMNDEYGRSWRSQAVFETDAEGRVHLEKDAPLRGTYKQAHSTGMLWAMERMDQGRSDFSHRDPSNEAGNSDRSSFDVDFCLDAETGRHRTRLHRFVRSSEVTFRHVEEPVRGILFQRPEAPPKPAILLIGGSNGTIDTASAALLASHGYTTLGLAYFRREGLPSHLNEVPIEYFYRAVDWLQRLPSVNGDRIALRGVSRGAEAALIVTSKRPDIDAVIAYAPSLLVRPGVNAKGQLSQSAWSLDGEPLSYVSQALTPALHQSLPTSSDTDSTMKDRFLASVFNWGLQHPSEFTEAVIPLENAEADMLFVSGTDDQVWPSTLFAEAGVGRLRSADYFMGGRMTLGGTARANARAARRAWDASCSFLADVLTSGASEDPASGGEKPAEEADES